MAKGDKKAGEVPEGFKKIYLRGGKPAPEGRESFVTEAGARYYLVPAAGDGEIARPTPPRREPDGVEAVVDGAAVQAVAGTNEIDRELSIIEDRTGDVLALLDGLTEVEQQAVLKMVGLMLPMLARKAA